MSDRPAREDLHNCPGTRPFWCAHPHCLWCNWDNDQNHDASALAAYLRLKTVRERHDDTKFHAADESGNRRYVAWLCVECAADEALLTWFTKTVRQFYPEATLLRAPERPDESEIDVS